MPKNETSDKTCREVVELLLDFLSGELPPRDAIAVEQHLENCPDCMAYLNGYQEAVKLGKAAFSRPAGRVRTPIAEEIVQAILAARRGKQ